MIKVSVIVATYNQTTNFVRAINSLLNQTYKNIEIIVVDDNIDDKIIVHNKKFIDKLKDPRIIYLKNEKNIGSAKTRNNGIINSTGEFVTFLDDDDYYMEDKIEIQLSKMIKTNSNISVTNIKLIDADTNKTVYNIERKGIDKFLPNDLFKYHLIFHLTATDTFMITRDLLDKVNYFDEIDEGDEYYLMLKLLKEEYRFTHINKILVKASVHKDTGLSSGDTKIEGENRLYKFKKQYFDQLTLREKNYIRARHYMVKTFTYYKRRNYFKMLYYFMLSILFGPIKVIKIRVNR